MVYLVGAGPGDPGLITVKALDLIRRADVILYDRLIQPLLLFEARADCILVDVGKSVGEHSLPQPEITGLLVEYGKTGKEIVRLKGGDPFLFGRGGEEVEQLAAEGIPFAVVPGVSALTAVTAYAGIPLTHRNFSSSVGVITGHAAAGVEMDMERLGNLGAGADTLVVFMGIGNLEPITAGIIAGGRSPETPAALIERGTMPRQRTFTATLGTIAAAARENGVSTPALLVIGETVSLAATLEWRRTGPLSGLRIAVTRPRAQSRTLAEDLLALGADPVLIPAIETVETIDTPDIRKVMSRLELFDSIVFSSANGAGAFFNALRKNGRDARALAGKALAAIGPATAEALAAHGVHADITAKTFIAEGLRDAILASMNVTGMRFLLVRSDIGRDTLAGGLRSAGAVVEEAVFYSTRQAEISPYAREQIRRGGVDIVTFTSASTVHGFFAGVFPADIGAETVLASIGPETSRAIARYGASAGIEAAEYTTAGLVRAILAWRENTVATARQSSSDTDS